MRVLNLRNATVALAAGLGLGGCAYSPYGGLGVGVGYGNAGYGNAYCDPYYDRYCSSYGYSSYGSPYGYSPYGSPYGYSPYGWYDGYYYPGTGYYVYDSYRRPYRWSDAQRRYWQDRSRYHGGTPTSYWGDFDRRDRDGIRIRRKESGGVISRVLRPRPVTVDQQPTSVEQQSATTAGRDGGSSRGFMRVRRSDTASSDGGHSTRGERRRSGIRIKRTDRNDD